MLLAYLSLQVCWAAPGIAAGMFGALAKANVNIDVISIALKSAFPAGAGKGR